MNIKFERDPLDYLKHIEKSLREAPHKQVSGGVLVAEILVDSIDGWCEFLREVIANTENTPGSGAVEQMRAADGACTCGTPEEHWLGLYCHRCGGKLPPRR